MKIRYHALGALGLLVSQTAHAAVYLDSVNVPKNTAGGYDGYYDKTAGMADSFTAAVPNFSGASLLLSADNPGDGGSSLVYLVPDDGSGGANGVAGSPTANTAGGTFNGFTGASLLGTISDSALAKTGTGTSLTTLGFSPTIGASLATLDQEYWIALVPNASSTVEWYYTDSATGVGEAGQSNAYAASPGQGPALTVAPNVSATGDNPPYGLIVAAPEPASLAILGVGLTGLGYFRRRPAKKA